MEKRILRELSEEKLFHLLLGDFEKFLSLLWNVLREPSTFTTEVQFKNSVPLMTRENLFHHLHSILSIRGLR